MGRGQGSSLGVVPIRGPHVGPRARQPGTTVWAPLGLRLPTWADLLVSPVRPCLWDSRLQAPTLLSGCPGSRGGGHPTGRAGPLHTAPACKDDPAQRAGAGVGAAAPGSCHRQNKGSESLPRLRPSPPAGLGATGPCCENQRTVLEATYWLRSPADRTQAPHSGSSAAQAAIRIGSAALSGGWKGQATRGPSRASSPEAAGRWGLRRPPSLPETCPQAPPLWTMPPGAPPARSAPRSCLFRRLTPQLQSQKLLVSELQRPEPRGSEGHLGQGSGQSSRSGSGLLTLAQFCACYTAAGCNKSRA